MKIQKVAGNHLVFYLNSNKNLECVRAMCRLESNFAGISNIHDGFPPKGSTTRGLSNST